MTKRKPPTSPQLLEAFDILLKPSPRKPKKRDPLSEAIKNAELIETAPHLHPAYVVELAYAIRTLRGALTLAKMATK